MTKKEALEKKVEKLTSKIGVIEDKIESIKNGTFKYSFFDKLIYSADEKPVETPKKKKVAKKQTKTKKSSTTSSKTKKKASSSSPKTTTKKKTTKKSSK